MRWAWRTPKCIEHCTSRVGQPQAYGNACYARFGATYSMTLIGSRTTAYTVMSAHAHCCEVLRQYSLVALFPESLVAGACGRVALRSRRVSRRMCPRMFMTCVTCVVCALNWRLTRLPTTCQIALFLINGRRHGMLPRRYPHGATAPAKRTCQPPHYLEPTPTTCTLLRPQCTQNHSGSAYTSTPSSHSL